MLPNPPPTPALDFRALFESAPAALLVLTPDFVIVAATDAYLRATKTTRAGVVGRVIFDAFPDNPADPDATGVRNLRASLGRVLDGRAADTMAVQKYNSPRPASEGGGFEERYWSPVNSPVLGPGGEVTHIIHRVEDVTDFVRATERAGELVGRARRTEVEVLRRPAELADANDRLRATNAALYREREFVSAVLEHAADGIVACDGEGVLRLFNRATREFHGLPEAPLPPEQWANHYDLYLPDGRTRMATEQVPLVRALREGVVRDAEMVIAPKGGTPRHLTASGRAILDAAGRRIGAVVVMHDVTERRRAEARRVAEARRTSEHRFQRLVEHSPLSTQLFWPDGRTRQVNRAFTRLFGITLGQLRDYNILRDPELVRTGIMPLMARAFAGEAVVIDPIPYVPDRGEYVGRTRWAGAHVYPVRDDAGNVEEVVLVHTDVTEQRQAEEEVRRSQRQLASIIDNAPSAIFIKDVSGRYLLVNTPFERMAGVPVGSMTGRVDSDLFPPEVAARFRSEDERVAACREPMTFEESFEFKGQPLTFVTNKFPLRDGAGAVYAVCGIATDVTALKRAEVAVRESEQRLRLGLRAGRTGTWDWDIACNRVVWSEQVYEFHGLRPEEFGGTGEDFIRLVHPEDAERVGSLIRAALHEGRPYEVEFRAVRPSGEVRWLFTTGQVTRDESGRPVRMMGALIDTTDRKRAEAERERFLEAERAARAEAERAGRMKDEFLATLSHELRTPLNAILGWSQILASATRDEEDLREGLRTIERNARAQTRIIEDLLDMSRIISGKVRLDVQRVDLADVVRAAVETVKPAADAKGVRLRAVLDPLAGPVSGDPNRLQQVFWNLLTNAVKFTPKGGQVQVLVERVNSHLEVSVIDTGEGIAPDFLPHVFDRFRQADATTTRRHGGLGLGLAIVKQLVELHGGGIRAKSGGIGMGSSFIVLIPLTVIHADAHPDPAPGRRHPVAGPVPQLGDTCSRIVGVRVLVVDDEPDARALVKRFLTDCDAVVTTAGSAREALELLRAERPDVLVSDIGMPNEDGYSLISQVRALRPDEGGKTPAIALTAYARAEDRMRAVMAGFQHHVVKPVEAAELITMVASLVPR